MPSSFGVRTGVPTGYFVVDGKRAGFRTPAPAAGQDEPRWLADPAPVPPPSGRVGGYPFEGLRILDLGIIVAGGELSRLFGDLGAEVIKVESADHPDGLRQTRVGDAMSESFAWTHRNHLALGLDLRNSEGKAIFGRLVAESDAVFANFKPGTLTSLGFSYDVLHAFNPGSCSPGVVHSGTEGRGAPGWATGHWCAPPPGSPVFGHPMRRSRTTLGIPSTTRRRSSRPRCRAGRCLLALAALIHRDRTGGGAHVHISQAEVVVNQLDTMFVAEAARATDVAEIHPDTSVHAVYPCAGDDEWCVISIRSDDEWRRATSVFGQPELANDPRFGASRSRVANRSELVAAVSAWTSTRTPVQAAGALQAAGVAAGPMNRPSDILEDPQLIERNLFRDMVHPLIARPLPAETGPAPFRHIPQAPQRPAPLPGQDSVQICRKLLGMTADETERLINERVMFGPAVTA